MSKSATRVGQLVLIAAASVWLISCASTGTNFNESKVFQIKKGETTEAKLIQMFGQPVSREMNSEGQKTLTWNYVEARVKGESFIPYAGPFLGESRSKNKTLFVTSGPDGKVISFNLSTGGTETRQSIQKELLVIRNFDERQGWLTGHEKLAEEVKLGITKPGKWGRQLAILIEAELVARSIRATFWSAALNDRKIEQLLKQGLQYVCDGEIEALIARGSDAGQPISELVINYRLQKTENQKLFTKQRVRFEVQEPCDTAISKQDLENLIKRGAKTIAEQIIDDIPADIKGKPE